MTAKLNYKNEAAKEKIGDIYDNAIGILTLDEDNHIVSKTGEYISKMGGKQLNDLIDKTGIPIREYGTSMLGDTRVFFQSFHKSDGTTEVVYSKSKKPTAVDPNIPAPAKQDG